MRANKPSKLLLVLFSFIPPVAFGTVGDTPEPTPSLPPRGCAVTYYDRNGDGKVDYELHSFRGWFDSDWALVDPTFSGYYTLRIEFAMVPIRHRVHIRVPHHVHLTPGLPPRQITD